MIPRFISVYETVTDLKMPCDIPKQHASEVKRDCKSEKHIFLENNQETIHFIIILKRSVYLFVICICVWVCAW